MSSFNQMSILQLKEEICQKLFEYEIIKFGNFTLKSGKQSEVYFDLRLLCSYPDLLRQCMRCYRSLLTPSRKLRYNLVCGVAYTGIPLATAYSLEFGIPMIFRRKEAKTYGLKKNLEGKFSPGQSVLIIDDVITSGTSIFETIPDLEAQDLKIFQILVLIDRRPPDQQTDYLIPDPSFPMKRYRFRSVFTADEIFKTLHRLGHQLPESLIPKPQPFENLLKEPNLHPLNRKLIEIMIQKQTNLVLSADVTTCQELQKIIDQTHEHICALKLHSDIIQDLNLGFLIQLKTHAKKHQYLLIEDRKFADIGNTTKLQYTHGPYQIINWADLTTYQGTMGPGTLMGLTEAIDEYLSQHPSEPRGLLPIVQASSSNHQINAKDTLNQIQQYPKHVIGIVAQEKQISSYHTHNSDCSFSNLLTFTPGVNLAQKGDNLAQQYRTPQNAIKDQECDLIIVGRGIYQNDNPKQAAQEYQQAGWAAYLSKFL